MKHFLLFIFGLVPMLVQAQVRHVGTVELLEFDDNLATFQVECQASKKGDVQLAAREFVFEKLFYEGVEGVNDDEKLINNLNNRNKFFLEKFFEGKYAPMYRFIAGDTLLDQISKNSDGKFTGTYTIVVKYRLLVKELKLNRLIVEPQPAAAPEN